MTAGVTEMPGQQLRQARLIVAKADLHNDAEVLSAAEVLITYGDWLDVERGRELRKALSYKGVREINRASRRRAWVVLGLIFAMGMILGASALGLTLSIIS